jgi:transposase
MLSKGDWLLIKAQVERGVYKKDIALALGVHPRTIRRAVARGGAPSGKRGRRRASKLEPYKGKIQELLKAEVWNAQVILAELRELGYEGGITILKDYIHPFRASRKSSGTVRFETPPGRQLQSDWGEIRTLVGGKAVKVHFIVNTLGFSRRFHFWCCAREDAEHTYEGLIRSLEYFGGVPREVLVDNQKSAVITHRIGEAVRYNERFVDLAGHYGFMPRACRPGRAQTKGKDERMVGYVKGNFFARYRSFESLAEMNALAERWLREVADPRVHGTVREVVRDRFAREAPELGPLPRRRYDTSYLEHRVVSRDGYVDVRGNRYSVPDRLCGRQVAVRITLDGHVKIYDGDHLVAEHRLRDLRDGWSTVASHHERLWRDAVSVERRDLGVYEEVVLCS